MLLLCCAVTYTYYYWAQFGPSRRVTGSSLDPVVLSCLEVVWMGSRDKRVKTWVDDETIADLDEFADEAGKSRSEVVRQAIHEYIDRDRFERVETEIAELKDQVDRIETHLSEGDPHAHTNPSLSGGKPATVVQKARAVAENIRKNHDEVVKDDVVEREIGNYAGGDDRTIRKHKKQLRKRGLLLEHPGKPPLWTSDTEQWMSWMADFARLNGRERAEDVVEDYPAFVTGSSNGIEIELDSDQIEQ